MKTLASTYAIISIMFFSCSSSSNEKPIEKKIIETHTAQVQEDKIEEIQLDNGKKWIVDSHMMAHIRNMEKEVYTFSEKKSNDYLTLANNLQSNINLLTSNCTMEGKAHDELHKWLLPYIELVNELSAIKDDLKAAEQFQKIHHSFTTFNQYFI